jgi:hypothetical protein
MAQPEQPQDRSLDDLVAALRADLRGAVITSDHPEYDQGRRVWNAMFDARRPIALLRCADENDVVRAIRRLRDVEVPVAVRGGGHHIAGFGGCDGGFVIDLAAMRRARLAGDGSRVRVEGGATLHDVDTATCQVGRAVPLGVVSPTGVGGLTLSGGLGWLTRLHGYTCDNLVSARVVTAAGSVMTASPDENPDLLWGLRGGGGNFGVVTEFEFQTYPVDEVVVAEAYHAISHETEADALLRFYRSWSGELPNHTTAWIVIERANRGYQGVLDVAPDQLVFVFSACCAVPSPVGLRGLTSMTRAGEPRFSRITTMSLVELQHRQDGSGSAARGMRSYTKGQMLSELTDDVIAAVAHNSVRMPTANSLFEMGTVGGAMADRNDMDAAVGLRDGRYLAGFTMMSRDGKDLEENIAWTREAGSSLSSGSAGGVYLNFSGGEAEARVLESLGAPSGGAKQRRLVAVKQRYDPGNFFRINHNIDPQLLPAVPSAP